LGGTAAKAKKTTKKAATASEGQAEA